MTGDQLLREAKAFEKEIVEARRHLHAHPGVRFEVGEAVDFVRRKLAAMGVEATACGRAGLTALVGGKKPGKVFLLRADMDGLPFEELTEEPFKSENGYMHACGHDLHTAMLLGAAKLLKAHEDEIQGTVKLMFQPAEEILAGAQDMIDAGVLENPKVDAGVMIHVMAGLPQPSGTVMVMAPGVSNPGADYFEIRVQGVGCHGSMPAEGVDPLNAACHIFIALQELNARELSLDQPAVLTIGTMQAGNAANAIPDRVVMGGTLRTFDEEVRTFVKKRLREIAQGVAAVFRATAEVVFTAGCPALENDAQLSAFMDRCMKELLGERAVSMAEENAKAGKAPLTGGSEDFACICQRVPGLMLALAAGNSEEGYAYPQHHPKVRFDESVLSEGCAVYAYAAMRWLEQNR